jgi:ribosomal protein L4
MDSLEMADRPRRRAMVELLAQPGHRFVGAHPAAGANVNVELSARNLDSVKTLRADCLSVRDLLGYDTIVMPREAVDTIHTLLGTAA